MDHVDELLAVPLATGTRDPDFDVLDELSKNPSGGHYVYLYRTPSGKPRYVGYGATPSRAIGHRDGTHNAALERWLSTAAHTLEIAGPFGSRNEGLHVESALISSLHPDFNVNPGDSTRFRPMGVPVGLADRVLAVPVTEAELGSRGEGALVVYLAAGDFMADGREKANPANPDVRVIATDAEAWWQVDRHIRLWRERPEERPRTLIALYGPTPRSRFVMGSFAIDTDRLGKSPGADRDGSLWRIPLLDRTNADASSLRGLRVEEATFGRGGHLFYHWVDRDGVTRWNGRA